jgi:hypothetical protein
MKGLIVVNTIAIQLNNSSRIKNPYIWINIVILSLGVFSKVLHIFLMVTFQMKFQKEYKNQYNNIYNSITKL